MKLIRLLGTSPAVIGTPSEQIGFQASEEYTSRISSPHPHGSQAHNVSPLRKGSSPGDADKKAGFESDLSSRLDSTSDAGPESELEDENTIHIDAPGRRISRIYGGAGHLESTEDLGPHTGSGGEGDGIHDEHGYGAPILASDEVAKEPFGWELQPAVSPLHESGGSAYYDDHNLHLRSGSASSSRPTSRPGSIHAGLPGIRLPSDRPLEALDEYEPLFSEGDEEGGKISGEKLPATSDKLKRPGLKVSLVTSRSNQNANSLRTVNFQVRISGKILRTAYNTPPWFPPRSYLKIRKRVQGASTQRRLRRPSRPLPGDRRNWLRRSPKTRRAS